MTRRRLILIALLAYFALVMYALVAWDGCEPELMLHDLNSKNDN